MAAVHWIQYLWIAFYLPYISQASHPEKGYTITVPNIIKRNSTASACVTFYGINTDVSVLFRLVAIRRTREHIQEEYFESGTGRCVDLRVPEFINRRKADLTTEVTARGPGGGPPEVLQTETRQLRVLLRDSVAFIQTDKPLYKPGQTVLIRILIIKTDLTPTTEPVPLIYLENAESYRVKQWNSTHTVNGLAQLEFPLSTVTSLGTWNLSVDLDGSVTSRAFQVQEYVLPRFEVALETPRYIEHNVPSFLARFCARYTYNKSVSGHYCFEACAGMRCLRTTGMVSGCHTVNVSPVWNATGRDILRVHAQVNVTDNSSGITLSSPVNTVDVSSNDIVIQFEEKEKDYFKPGIEFKGKVSVSHTDGSPAVQEALQVSLWHTGDPPGTFLSKHHQQTVTTNDSGEAVYAIPPVSDLVDLYNIRVSRPSNDVTPDYQREITIRRWYSPTQNYLQIEPVPVPLAACAQEIRLNLTYISSEAEERNTSITYQIMLDNGIPHATGQIHQLLLPSVTRSDVPSETGNSESQQDTIIHGRRHDRYLVRDNRKGQLIIPQPYYHIGVYGRIKQWSFYLSRFRAAHIFYLQVWRPVSSSRNHTFMLVEQTLVSRFHHGQNELLLDEDDEIPVQPNDVIAIYCPEMNLIRFNPMDRCPNGHVMTSAIRGLRQVIVGKNYDFRPISSRIECREYAVQAYVAVDYYIAEMLNRQMVPRSFPITIHIPEPMTSSGKVVMYYVTSSGEMVADSIVLKAEPCLKNQVHMDFLSPEAYPGDRVFYRLSAQRGSLCAIGMVDRSVYLIQANNNFNQEQVLERAVQTYDERSPQKIQRACEVKDSFPLADTLDAFQLTGMAVLTNLAADNRPCHSEDPTTPSPEVIYGRGSLGAQEPNSSEHAPGLGHTLPHTVLDNMPHENGMDIDIDHWPEQMIHMTAPAMASVNRRFYFPETWLWDTHVVGESGQSLLNGTLPHTLTEWQGSSICLHPSLGIGISNQAYIRAFQPFFLALSLPYSVHRMEHLRLRLVVYSYLEECFELQVTMEPVEGIALAEGRQRQVICMCNSQSTTLEYEIVPHIIGRRELTFRAESVHNRSVCSELTVELPALDAITKPLLIEPEGTEEEYTTNALVCLEGFTQETRQFFNFSLPYNYVQGSANGYVSVIADVMGPTLEGVHSFIKMPSGCGEQNLAKLAVNVLALDYLIATQPDLPDHQRQKALRFIEEGYQRQLEFRLESGAYSAFGNDAEEQSLWLTSFVIKTFWHVDQYMYVDGMRFFSTVTWVQRQQRTDGCFEPLGMIHNLAMTGTNESHVALTSYILVALLEAGVSQHDRTILQGFRCLDAEESTADIYSRALLAHAHGVRDSDHMNLFRQLQILRNLSRNEGGLTYWKVDPGAEIAPIDIETTAYVLRAILAPGRRQDIIEGSRIVRWLTKQRNGRGGFLSTQDTVVAIEALSKYARLNFMQEINLHTWLEQTTPEDPSYQLSIDAHNRMVVERWPVTDLPRGDVRVVVTGIGCLLLQAVVQYNRPPVVMPDPFFALDLDVHTIRHPQANMSEGCPDFYCDKRRLMMCARYTGPSPHATMTVVDMHMVSGWVPDQRHLEEEERRHDLLSDHKFNSTTGILELYFIKMMHTHTCVNVILEREYEVTNTIEAEVEIFESTLGRAHSQLITYQIADICTEDDEGPGCILDIIH